MDLHNRHRSLVDRWHPAAGKPAFVKETGIGFLCPSEYRWDLTLTLETDKAINEPLYFS
jgi:hypothetical protein